METQLITPIGCVSNRLISGEAFAREEAPFR